MQCVLRNISLEPGKIVWVSADGWNVLSTSVRCVWSPVLCKSTVSALISFANVEFIIGGGALLLISLFTLFVCSIGVGALMLCFYSLHFYNWSFYHPILTFGFCDSFWCMIILSDMSHCLPLLTTVLIFFSIFFYICQPVCVLKSQSSFFCTLYNWTMSFFKFS